MNSLILFTIWCLYVMSDGARDGVMYHLRSIPKHQKLGFNEHVIFSISRGLFLLAILYPEIIHTRYMYLYQDLSTIFIHTLPYLLSFSFLHNGAYYKTREYLVKGTYPKGWFAQSQTSTAKLTKYNTPLIRTILFIISICIIYLLHLTQS